MPPLLSKIDSLSSIKFLLFHPHNVFNSTNVLWMTIWEHRNSVWSSIHLETKPSSNIYGANAILSTWHFIVIVLPYPALSAHLSLLDKTLSCWGRHWAVQESPAQLLQQTKTNHLSWQELKRGGHCQLDGAQQLNNQKFPLIAKTHKPPMHFVGPASPWTNNHQLKHQLSFLYPSNHFQIASEIGLTIANNYWFWQITNN